MPVAKRKPPIAIYPKGFDIPISVSGIATVDWTEEMEGLGEAVLNRDVLTSAELRWSDTEEHN